MTENRIILIGAGGHAHACIDVIEQHCGYQIAGLVGMKEEVDEQHLGYRVIGTDDELPDLAKKHKYAIITVGQIASPQLRIRLWKRAVKAGFSLPTIIAPTACVSRHASIGEGTIIMHGAVVNAGAKIGANCIINTKALIEHDASVEDHCHISTGVILNGCVHVGAGSFVGSGSIVRDGISIGKNCVVGLGVSVRHNQPDSTKFVGLDNS